MPETTTTKKSASTPAMCKLCHHRHWNNEPHVFDQEQPRRPLAVLENEAPMLAEDRRRYRQLKVEIHDHWIAMAEKARIIRDQRLYREEYPTFEAFCEAELGLTRQRVYQLMASAVVSSRVDKAGLPPPANERVARALAPLNDKPEEQVAAWSETVAAHGDVPTPAQTAAHVFEHLPPPADDPDTLDGVSEENTIDEAGGGNDYADPFHAEDVVQAGDAPPESDVPPDDDGGDDRLTTLLENAAEALVELNNYLVANPPALGQKRHDTHIAAQMIAKLGKQIADALV